MKTYYVYIMTNQNNHILYTGITNNLERRVYEHKSKKNKESFTSKYNCTKLVWYEHTNSIQSAIGREKKIKGGNRQSKLNLIIGQNPSWKDLSKGWFDNYK